ncbi:MAG TPA: phage portal protein [Lachnospiraceae bacterium]|nr:phage portal protein [Lachnospiraceae bacterium]
MLFNRLLSVRNEDSSGISDPADWFINLFGGNTVTSSGETITSVSSLNIATVYACINVKSNAIAKLPMQVFKTTQTGRERDKAHRIAYLLEKRPNEFTTPFNFKHTISVHQNLWGTAYIYIESDRKGVKNLWLLPPDGTTAYIDIETGLYTYITTLKNQTLRLQESEVIKLPYLSLNGVKGKSPIQVARETLGVMQASNKFIGGFYKNGTSSKGIINTPVSLESSAKQRLREEWQKANGGTENAGGIAVVDAGMVYTPISMPLADAEFIATNKFNVGEIAKIFNVPPHMIGDLDHATFSNIEQQSMDFISNCIQPSLVAWEEEFNYKLFVTLKDAGNYIKFDLDSAMRADSVARATFYEKMTGIGAYSINDVLEKEDMDSIGPEGDAHRVDLNHVSATLVDEYQMTKAKNGDKSKPQTP